jgi:hypothetical protein
MYISSILWFLSWPAIIILAYFLISFALKQFEKSLEKKEGS